MPHSKNAAAAKEMISAYLGDFEIVKRQETPVLHKAIDRRKLIHGHHTGWRWNVQRRVCDCSIRVVVMLCDIPKNVYRVHLVAIS